MLTALLAGQLVWNIPMLSVLLGIAGWYLWMVRRYTDIPFTHKKPMLFLLSLALFYITMGSPLTALSHLSFSLHMIQMSVLYFVIPPLFLVGIPNQLFQKFQNLPLFAKLAQWMLKPKGSLLLFSLLLLIYHFPIVLNTLAIYPLVHNGYVCLLLFLSLGMWWPFASPDPAHRFEEQRKKRYTKWCGALLMPACFFFHL